MITSAELTAALFALSTGYPDRAVNVVESSEGLEDDLRKRLFDALKSDSHPEAQAEALGDVLLAHGADQMLVNECYRAAFYLGSRWAELADNPLYAYFLANRAYAVLDKWVHYFPIYHRHLARFRGTDVRLLEIGVYRGGGLALWQSYLGPGATVVGTDIDPVAQRSVQGRFDVVLGDQEDPQFLHRLVEEHGPFDVVVDDGGHTMGQQIVSAETLFPHVRDDGLYIVEDCHTSYWDSYGGGLRRSGTFVEWTKERMDDLHARYEPAIDQSSVWARHLDGLHVYDSVVVLDKRRRFRPFNEMSGSASYLFGDRFSEGLAAELVGTRDAVVRERDELLDRIAVLEGRPAADVAAELARRDDVDELRLARAELSEARAKLASVGEDLAHATSELDRTRNQLLESWDHVQQMRRSTSWRVTAPLRGVRRLRRS